MEDQQNPAEEAGRQNEDAQEWQTPVLIVEEVESATKGGPIGDIRADDAFYT